MLALAAWRSVPGGIRLTAGAVVAVSLYAFIRGYLRRIEVDEKQITLRSPLHRLRIARHDVRLIDR